MESIIFIIIILASAGVVALSGRNKAFYSLLLHGLLVLTGSSWAIRALAGGRTLMFSLDDHLLNAPMLSIDSLSAYFLLIISFTMLTSTLYAFGYLKPYQLATSRDKKSDLQLSVHHLALLSLHISLILIPVVRGGKAFLLAWELMAISSFGLLLFHKDRPNVLRIALRYFLQMQISVGFLAAALWYVRTQGLLFGFDGVTAYFGTHTGLPLVAALFIGFGFVAGFVPLQSWLPNAHLIAPSHVSGILSGIVIKMGIYGLLRVLTGIHLARYDIGVAILLVSFATMLYGVIQSTRQKDLKRLLAYSSIQHIGIIGTGIGLGMIGLALNKPLLASLGFAGGILHVLNHSLSKSLLFYGTGAVYEATHTQKLAQLGGLVKRMPQTAMIFLIGSIAICGLPPLNGFISEFMIYDGLFRGLQSADLTLVMLVSIVILLAMTGLSMIAAGRAFSRVFLGAPRAQTDGPIQHDPTMIMLLPETLIVGLMLLIAFWPNTVLQVVSQTLAPFAPLDLRQTAPVLGFLHSVGIMSAVFVMLAGIGWFCRSVWLHRRADLPDANVSQQHGYFH